MELTKKQEHFLKTTVSGNWILNSNGEIDVDGSVYITKSNNSFKGYKNLEIPIQFGRVDGNFYIEGGLPFKTLKGIPRSCEVLNINNIGIETLDYFPTDIDKSISILRNNLTDYFKSIKEEDFKFWDKIFDTHSFLSEYPFLVNIVKKYITKDRLLGAIQKYPQIKLYLE